MLKSFLYDKFSFNTESFELHSIIFFIILKTSYDLLVKAVLILSLLIIITFLTRINQVFYCYDLAKDLNYS